MFLLLRGFLLTSLLRCSRWIWSWRSRSRGVSVINLPGRGFGATCCAYVSIAITWKLCFTCLSNRRRSLCCRQGRKTAEWLKKIPLRACACAFRWPCADAIGSKEWAIRRSDNRAIMNVGCLAESWRALCWNTSLKGLVYNGIILFCFALEVIFVIVLR